VKGSHNGWKEGQRFKKSYSNRSGQSEFRPSDVIIGGGGLRVLRMYSGRPWKKQGNNNKLPITV
jgi:hypothetical protein